MAHPAIKHEDFIDSHPGVTAELDYEVELAVVIGKEGKNISKEEAQDYIFGYTILNDVSARDLREGILSGIKERAWILIRWDLFSSIRKQSLFLFI